MLLDHCSLIHHNLLETPFNDLLARSSSNCSDNYRERVDNLQLEFLLVLQEYFEVFFRKLLDCLYVESHEFGQLFTSIKLETFLTNVVSILSKCILLLIYLNNS